MNWKTERNAYDVDIQNNTATFDVRSKCDRASEKFTIDLDDFDAVNKYLWRLQFNNVKKTRTFINSHDDTLIQAIASKYTYAHNSNMPLIIGRLKSKVNDFRKDNLIIKSRLEDKPVKSLTYSRAKLESLSGYLHVSSWREDEGTVYCAQITAHTECLINLRVKKTFKDTKYLYAEKRTIYAAYLFEKMFYGEDFSEEEYARKEEAFKVLDKAERAEVEDAIVEQLEKLRLARKKIDNYYQSQTLVAKLASGEVIVRPDWKVGDVEKSDDVVVEPETEPEPQPEPEPEHITDDYTIKCSKQLLNLIHLNDSKDRYSHVFCSRTGEYPSWGVNMTLTNQQNVGTVKFSELRYADAKAMAVYAAYLFEKLVYGDNLPKAEYNRKLDVIKTLSTEDIEFVNEMVAPKLEKVYTILKELASDKPAESNEPLIDYEIGRSKDAVFEQIKQMPLKDDALETAAVDDELFAERFKRVEIPERNKLAIQQAVAKMKQKPSLFQRIKNWFAN
jgi:hypothetical protein